MENDCQINISRKLLNEREIDERYGFISSKDQLKNRQCEAIKSICPEPILTDITPPLNKDQWKTFILTHLPFLSLIWNYQLNYIIGDIIAGLTVGTMRIPQSLGYSLLANLPAVYGLYVSFIPVLVYSFFGSSRHLSIGTFAVVSLMVSNAITNVLGDDPDWSHCLQAENTSTESYINISNSSSCEDIKVEIAVTLSFLSGIIMLVMGLMQFGFITLLLSESLISGYTTGAAVHVFTSQLTKIFGIKSDPIRGIFSVPKIWYSVIVDIFNWSESVNTATVIISIICLSFLIIITVIDKNLLRKLNVCCCYYSKKTKSCITTKRIKWFIPFPSALIAVVLATGISYGANLNERYNVDIVKHVPLGFPSITAPNPSLFLKLLPDAFVISIVTFSVGVSVAQLFAKKFNYTINSNQELLAYGACNIIGSFFSCFNASGSLARSAITVSSGGKTQLTHQISSIIVLIVFVALGKLFEPLPETILSCIIWVALYGTFTQVIDIWRYMKLCVYDMLIWIVAFIGTVLLGVDIGLGVGIVFSLGVLVFRTVLPKSCQVGRIPNTEIYRDIENYELVEPPVGGVVIYRFLAPLCFVNCKVFVRRIEIVCGINNTNRTNQESSGLLPSLIDKCMKNDEVNGSIELEVRNDSVIRRSRSYEVAVEDNNVTNDDNIHTLIIDCSSMSFMDANGVKTLKQVCNVIHPSIQWLHVATVSDRL
jgi:high affinity sulfate transporter 1